MLHVSDDNPENSEESYNENESTENDICGDIAVWAVRDGITHASLERLLQLLRKSNRYPQLPAKANALLGNPTNGLFRSVEPGYYWHNGLKTCLEKLFEEISSDETLKTLFLSINIDGVPLFKSSDSCPYPILGSIPCSQQIFFIGCYHGHKKPKDFNNFLKDFVDETIELITTGYNCRGKTYNINPQLHWPNLAYTTTPAE
ncbi:atp synthase subunit mitochondrial [Lasius niger]|uniref:Atp synthase subunit mitochondrial n=1 Tax=Lasius niger TaxID=67767 RepID=A0A0J7KIJ4_LASNI|nr:atp synthase subunit mitochondrial [Lasius niger]